jgi:hypothetical protein
MNKPLRSLMLLPVALLISMPVLADEFTQQNFNGMQLAWVRLPATPAEEEAKAKAAAKAKRAKSAEAKKAAPPVAAPAQVIKPAQVPIPASKPAPATAPKTVQPPVIQPVIIPARPPQVKPAPAPPAKPRQPRAAQETQAFEWLVGIGYETGGEELGQVTFSDGSTAAVYANSGIVLNVGGIIPNGTNSPFSTQISVGYKTGGPRIWNNDVNWSAIPLDIIENYRINSLRMGLGINYQINPQLKVNLPTSNFITKYNNALGLVVQFSWAPVREHYSIDLRYTSIKFQQSDLPGAPLINGSVGGIYANYRF